MPEMMKTRARVGFEQLDMENEEYLTPAQLAKRWGYKKQSLANMRYKGEGPQFLRLNTRKVLYPMSAVLNYEKLGLNNPDKPVHIMGETNAVNQLLKQTGVKKPTKRK